MRERMRTSGKLQKTARASSCPQAALATAVFAALPWVRRVWELVRPPADLPPMSRRPMRIGQAFVALFALGFVVFFTAYLFGQHDAFHTNAEDMGIMTQALWNTTHGAPLHQTICNMISDSNCIGDVSRLAIHFEPIMFVIALAYALAPTPKTLQLIQVLVVALGAFPVYWIAARRLRSAPAGVLFAVLYLVYPALDSAVTSDFHAVTLAAPLLMFALYFLLTRNVVGFFVAAGLAITTKEEVVLTVAMLGLYALIVQGRRRFASVVLLMSAAYLVMELLVMHALSPVGHSPLASRYAAFGSSPISIVVGVLTHPLLVVRHYLLDTSRVGYLVTLAAPLVFVCVCSPAMVLLAAPALGINILSSDAAMYSGGAQYNAEIVPILIVAAIDGSAKLAALGMRVLPGLAARCRQSARGVTDSANQSIGAKWAAMRGSVQASAHLARVTAAWQGSRMRAAWQARGISLWRGLMTRGGVIVTPVVTPMVGLAGAWWRKRYERYARALAERRVYASGLALGPVLLLVLALIPVGADLGIQQRLGFLPIGRTFAWPQTTEHMRVAESLMTLIPPDASVSAQTDLISHLSNRRLIYLFPYGDTTADYDFVDVTGNDYPYASFDVDICESEIRSVLDSGNYQLVAANDGYILLKRTSAPSADPPTLPPSFYSFTQTTPSAIANPVHGVSFDAGDGIVRLLGYDLSPEPDVYLTSPWLNVTTYWKVTGHISGDITPEVVVTYRSGHTESAADSATTTWLPMTQWPDGTTMVVQNWPIKMTRDEPGAVRIGVRVRTLDNDGTLTGALPLRPSRTITPAALGGISVASAVSEGGDGQDPLPQAQVGEEGTLISFATEHVIP